MSRRTVLGALGIAIALAGCSATSATAADGSLVYTKRGDVHLARPDGSGERRLTGGGGYAWPSQADDGRIVAVRQTDEGGRTPRRLHVLGRDGRAIGAPIETVRVDNANMIGPLTPKVSPDGSIVAYVYFDSGVSSDRSRSSVAYTRTDMGTEPDVFGGALGGYLTPSWLADGRALVFYGAQRTSQIGIDTPGGDYLDWFGDPDVGTLLTDGEITTTGDRLVAVGDRNDLRFYEVAAPPPAAPRLACVLTGFAGDVDDPTWAPDGRALAWAESDGIHVMALPDLAGCDSAARPLVIRGGESPDWGPAAAPPGRTSLAVPKSASRATVARRGLRVRVRHAQPGPVTLVARVGRATVARGTATVGAGGSATVQLRPTAAGRRTLGSGARRLTIAGAGTRATVRLEA